ncbi:hypothetical protein [Pseudomonas chlororaphis]|uniref:hypothetical protein n=1 Tax=Pseudomonas chlororaphis TaxID=587753 RepID=UPI000F49B687|nr:hypothetical protein [Pseudomonas chlororaphis]ROL89287.1 hypothetical protein BK637_08680 [Pseudomonas chlororaphis]
MNSTHQRFQIRACHKLALEQNQRLFNQARALNAQAYELLENGRLDIDTFERYRRLRNKAEAKQREAIEHLRLVNQEFAELESRPKSTPDSDPAILQQTGR